MLVPLCRCRFEQSCSIMCCDAATAVIMSTMLARVAYIFMALFAYGILITMETPEYSTVVTFRFICSKGFN